MLFDIWWIAPMWPDLQILVRANNTDYTQHNTHASPSVKMYSEQNMLQCHSQLVKPTTAHSGMLIWGAGQPVSLWKVAQNWLLSHRWVRYAVLHCAGELLWPGGLWNLWPLYKSLCNSLATADSQGRVERKGFRHRCLLLLLLQPPLPTPCSSSPPQVPLIT